jgi:eukaryotic-like serine/threonine-protein kinase
MSPDQERRLEEIFSAARDLPPLERAAFLERACRGDAELRRQADSLLAAHEQAGQFLQPTVALSMPKALSGKPGDRIGRYKLLEQIGEGGFGVVWMAEQEEPVRRRVALKIIKLGMDTKEVVARFEAERQALAMMEHPNIARVFDGGATDTGRPYFVMELVKGVPITEYCDANKLPTRERLALFMQVCQAVQHAHQKGVIHRDLKPSNILVTVQDDRPVPKVIDFGVAKATQARLTEKTVFTRFQQFIGTPAYMSPEQAGLASLDVDTRSDVYSLGVLLYELLTGQTPFDTQKLLEKGYEAVMQTIRDEEPPKPSTRLNTLAGQELSAVAARRGAEPARLNRLVRGDLDWIVMKALEKDRKRRYDTPGTLAQDIARHLSSEPVLATPPSVGYLFQKYVRRHRLGVGVGIAVALTVLTGAGVSLWQAVVARQQAQLAENRRREAEASREVATTAQRHAQQAEAAVSHQLAQQYVDKGAARLEEGDNFGSLIWFVEALRLDKDSSAAEAAHRLRIGSVLHASPRLVQIFNHRDAVIAVAVSPDGKRVVTGSVDKTARVWNLQTGEPVGLPMEHAAEVVCVAFSPDGSKVATGSCDSSARVWDAQLGVPVTSSLQHGSNVLHVAFSPDGRRVVTASSDHTARVWDAVTGNPITPPLQHGDTVRPTVFSPDGRQVLTASWDKTARLWDAATGQPAGPAMQHAGEIRWAAFSPDGRFIATASEDHTAGIWNARTGAAIASLPHSEEVNFVAFSPDSRRLVTASSALGWNADSIWNLNGQPGEARLWDVASRKALGGPMQHRLSVSFAAFNADGSRLVTCSDDMTARVWDFKNGVALPALTHGSLVFRAAFTPDGRNLVTASLDHTARLWDLACEEKAPVTLEDSVCAGVFAFSPDGRSVVGKYIGGPARVWDALTGMALTPRIHGTNLNQTIFSPDSRLVATAGADHTARIWEVNSGKPLSPPLTHGGEVWCIAFSPDGQRIATGSGDCSARIFDVRTGELLLPLLRHDGPVRCVAFSPDGRLLATAGEDKTARMWDAAEGTPLFPPMQHEDMVVLTAFSPNGRLIATASRDGQLRIWDAKTGSLAGPPMKQARACFFCKGIESMSFSPDGQALAVVDTEGTARVWKVDTGEPITPRLQNRSRMLCATFSRDSSCLLTAGMDGFVRLRDAATGYPITPPLLQKAAVDNAWFTPDGRAVRTVAYSTGDGTVATWDLVPEQRPASQLLLLAEVLSAHRMDASGSLVPLAPEGISNAWSTLRAR